MLLNPLNPCQARPKHASVREVERRVPGSSQASPEMLQWTKRPCLKQSGRHGPTHKVGLWLPHALCDMPVDTPKLMNVHTHIHGHIKHTNVMHTYIQECFKYCPFLLPLLVVCYTVLAQLNVTSYFLEFPLREWVFSGDIFLLGKSLGSCFTYAIEDIYLNRKLIEGKQNLKNEADYSLSANVRFGGRMAQLVKCKCLDL